MNLRQLDEKALMLTPHNRVILFVRDVEKCAEFYLNAFGFKVLPGQKPPSVCIEFDTGGCRLATSKPASASPHKIVFPAQDVPAARAALIARSVKLGPAKQFGPLTLCDGRDPDGNAFQISN